MNKDQLRKTAEKYQCGKNLAPICAVGEKMMLHNQF